MVQELCQLNTGRENGLSFKQYLQLCSLTITTHIHSICTLTLSKECNSTGNKIGIFNAKYSHIENFVSFMVYSSVGRASA